MSLYGYKINKILNENLIKSGKLIKYNIDSFENGESNILLVTGLSGSGKTTSAKYYCDKYDAELISLDYFESNYKYDEDTLKMCGDVFYQYLIKDSQGKTFREKSLSSDRPSGKDLSRWIRKFVSYVFKYCNSHKSSKYVIEGVQLYSCADFNEVKKYPIIINTSSVLKSISHRVKRDGYEGEFIKMVNWYLDEDKILNKFKSNYKE